MTDPLQNDAPNSGEKTHSAALDGPATLLRQINGSSVLLDPEIYYEEWAFLARVSPEDFESRRKAVIDEMLRNVPDRQRAACVVLQNKIDQIRQDAVSPEIALLAMAAMVVEHLGRLGQAWGELHTALKAHAEHLH